MLINYLFLFSTYAGSSSVAFGKCSLELIPLLPRLVTLLNHPVPLLSHLILLFLDLVELLLIQEGGNRGPELIAFTPRFDGLLLQLVDAGPEPIEANELLVIHLQGLSLDAWKLPFIEEVIELISVKLN